MKKTLGKRVLFGLILVFILIFTFSFVSASTNVYVNPDSSNIGNGENTIISISIDTTDSVYAVSFDLSFDKNILNGVSSGDGGFLGKDGSSIYVVSDINNTAGKFSFAATRFQTTDGVSGTGAIANITFNAISLGQSDLIISNVQISDPNLDPVSANIVNGVLIVNTPPVVSNLQLNPISPVTTNNLVGSYDYFDADGHAESGTEIRWYKNSVLQSAHNDLLTVPSSATSKGQSWYFTVKPKDDISFGDLKTSSGVVIQNSVPVLSPIGNKNVNEGQLLQFSVSASDNDSDSLTYTAVNLPSGASFIGQQFSWTPGYDQQGNYPVTFNVTDGTDSDFEIITITVNDVNRAPTIDWFSPANLVLKFREGYSLLFNHSSSDLDGDSLSYSWKFDNVERATTKSWTYSAVIGDCGLSHKIVLNVSDGFLTDSQSWDITVNLQGDVDLDRDVDIFDLAAIGLAYASSPGDGSWNENADIHPGPGENGEPEGNGKINIFDLATTGLNYGRTC